MTVVKVVIKPPGSLKELGERRHETLENLYNKGGSVAALIEAIGVSRECKIPVPVWAMAAIVTILDEIVRNSFAARMGRNASWLKQYHQDMIDYERFETIQELREHGVKWKHVYESASQISTDRESHGTAATMEKAYKRFKRRIRTTPWRYYIFSIYKLPRAGGRPFNKTHQKLIEDIINFDNKES